jgi:hypothetical protein
VNVGEESGRLLIKDKKLFETSFKEKKREAKEQAHI